MNTKIAGLQSSCFLHTVYNNSELRNANSANIISFTKKYTNVTNDMYIKRKVKCGSGWNPSRMMKGQHRIKEEINVMIS